MHELLKPFWHLLIGMIAGDIIAGYLIIRNNRIGTAKTVLAILAGNVIMVPLFLFCQEVLPSGGRRWLVALLFVSFIANVTGLSLVIHFLAPDANRPFLADSIQTSLPYSLVITTCAASPIFFRFLNLWR
ncbi:MAG: hypothetical protein E3J72_16140 [Planctomycetota bacterium]|nr:MAG: hypothetical protein E3J72_16140 [Planctomycetota bacterium]